MRLLAIGITDRDTASGWKRIAASSARSVGTLMLLRCIGTHDERRAPCWCAAHGPQQPQPPRLILRHVTSALPQWYMAACGPQAASTDTAVIWGGVPPCTPARLQDYTPAHLLATSRTLDLDLLCSLRIAGLQLKPRPLAGCIATV